MKRTHSPAMTGVSANLSSFHSDCGFDHMIHTLSDAKFHDEADGINCGAIQASALNLWIII